MANISRAGIQALDWQSAKSLESLQSLHDSVVGAAADAAEWYFREKDGKKRWSRFLRFVAIVLTTIGGLEPIFEAAGISMPIWSFTEMLFGVSVKSGHVGYLFFAVAAALLGFDRFFGLSSGWIRYITTGMAINRQIDDFRLEWQMLMVQACAAAPSPTSLLSQDIEKMLTALRGFAGTVSKLITDETQAWVTEFQSSMAQLEKSAREQTEAMKPGIINLQIDAAGKLDEPYVVTRDGLRVGTDAGATFPMAHVAPGYHTVTVTGKVGGNPVSGTQVVNVPAGGVVSATVKLS